MANHIHKLQAAVTEAGQRDAATAEVIELFRIHLNSAKFVGTDPATGERKDWIATGDVLRWLASIETARRGF